MSDVSAGHTMVLKQLAAQALREGSGPGDARSTLEIACFGVHGNQQQGGGGVEGGNAR
jgi:hypothetical protein